MLNVSLNNVLHSCFSLITEDAGKGHVQVNIAQYKTKVRRCLTRNENPDGRSGGWVGWGGGGGFVRSSYAGCAASL